MNIKFWIVSVLVIGMFNFSSGQVTSGIVGKSAFLNSTQNLAGGVFAIGASREIKGSHHIFNTWENNGVVRLKGDKMFKIKSINVNVEKNNFESKVSKDSVFVFDTDGVEHMLINGRKFKNLYVTDEEKHKICEIIVEGKSFKVFKVYRGVVKKGEVDPYSVSPVVDKYIIKEFYYIEKDESTERFKLNKKSVLTLFSNNKKEIQNYVKENKLSWNKVADFKSIFQKWRTL